MLCSPADVCANDPEHDADSDTICGDVDCCPYDGGNDVDADRICSDLDSCVYDPLNDVDSDAVCANLDICPFDIENDIDGDGICGDVDSCDNDRLNDIDSDALCALADSCLFDPGNDADSDWICGDLDSCPRDPWNDFDSDSVCAIDDSCPLDIDNDADSDSLCGDVDSCSADWRNDGDSDHICELEDSCPNDVANDEDSDLLCFDVDSCSRDRDNDADGDQVCGDIDNCPFDRDNDADSDSSCSDSYASVDQGVLARLEQLCASGRLSAILQVEFGFASQFDVSASTFALDSFAHVIQATVRLQLSEPTALRSSFDSDLLALLAIELHIDVQQFDLEAYITSQGESPTSALRRELSPLSVSVLSVSMMITFDTCLNDVGGSDADSDWICFVDDSCPADAFNDLDSDGVCESSDSCRFDPYNDADSDSLCATSHDLCVDGDTQGVGLGPCATYAMSRANAGHCVEDGVCEICGCSCLGECSDVCAADPSNDIDGDRVCSDVDSCPTDYMNDGDGDGICDSVDSCVNSSENDEDFDGLCWPLDSCPVDAENDVDSDLICGNVDSCPLSPENLPGCASAELPAWAIVLTVLLLVLAGASAAVLVWWCIARLGLRPAASNRKVVPRPTDSSASRHNHAGDGTAGPSTRLRRILDPAPGLSNCATHEASGNMMTISQSRSPKNEPAAGEEDERKPGITAPAFARAERASESQYAGNIIDETADTDQDAGTAVLISEPLSRDKSDTSGETATAPNDGGTSETVVDSGAGLEGENQVSNRRDNGKSEHSNDNKTALPDARSAAKGRAKISATSNSNGTKPMRVRPKPPPNENGSAALVGGREMPTVTHVAMMSTLKRLHAHATGSGVHEAERKVAATRSNKPQPAVAKMPRSSRAARRRSMKKIKALIAEDKTR
eukprot:INCI8256.2.p1 GENE.INCI8256.2~~INCI8256.2.p1  ORF type:complete len:908 (-),score=203.29 INCI8256.2:36-2759(-)